jgi:hypothetical protein
MKGGLIPKSGAFEKIVSRIEPAYFGYILYTAC